MAIFLDNCRVGKPFVASFPEDHGMSVQGEPDRQVFAKFKHLSRKAAARSSETIYVTIGEILRAFTPTECATGYAQS